MLRSGQQQANICHNLYIHSSTYILKTKSKPNLKTEQAISQVHLAATVLLGNFCQCVWSWHSSFPRATSTRCILTITYENNQSNSNHVWDTLVQIQAIQALANIPTVGKSKCIHKKQSWSLFPQVILEAENMLTQQLHIVVFYRDPFLLQDLPVLKYEFQMCVCVCVWGTTFIQCHFCIHLNA